MERPNRRAPRTFLLLYPFPHPFTSSPPPPSSASYLFLSPYSGGRPVALIIREYVAVMLSIPPANSNRAHPPTWWYRQEKWPHALQSQHFCVGCGRERGSSPRTRGSERERLCECLEETSLRARDPPRPAADLPWFPSARANHNRSRYVIRRKDVHGCRALFAPGRPPRCGNDKQCIEWLVYQ